jgi:DNA-binding MarR family transcriptional regulator
MNRKKAHTLECCLFFTANSLARDITRMGEEEFARIGLSPSHAFLLTLAIESPGISQKELSQSMNMAPSTVSRFIDVLAKRELVEKVGEGRVTCIHPTVKGEQLRKPISEVWSGLYHRYSAILGKESGDELTRMCLEASKKLQEET